MSKCSRNLFVEKKPIYVPKWFYLVLDSEQNVFVFVMQCDSCGFYFCPKRLRSEHLLPFSKFHRFIRSRHLRRLENEKQMLSKTGRFWIFLVVFKKTNKNLKGNLQYGKHVLNKIIYF